MEPFECIEDNCTNPQEEESLRCKSCNNAMRKRIQDAKKRKASRRKRRI